MKYPQIKDGEWFSVTRHHRNMCCDCGLVHDIEFVACKILKTYEDGNMDVEETDNLVMMKCTRNDKATAASRLRKCRV